VAGQGQLAHCFYGSGQQNGFLLIAVTDETAFNQGCQTVYFQTKIPNLGKFWVLVAAEDVGTFYDCWVYFTAIWYILLPFGIFCCHLVYFVAIWCIYGTLVYVYPFWYVVQEKFGNPAFSFAVDD
jgi:hypothetical protein